MPVTKSDAALARNTAMPAKSVGAPAPGRRARQHALVQAGHLAPRALGQLRIDPARQHRVDLDVVLRPGGRAGAAELHDAAFARRIGRREARREDRHHRADIDDLAAARLLHVRIGGVRAHERAGEVGVDHRVPFGGAERVRRLADVRAGIVDQNVQPPMLGRRLVDHRAAGFFARHIHVGELGLAARVLDLLHRRRALGGVAARKHHGRAGRRHALRHAEPDAAIAAGDDRDAAGQIEQVHWTPPAAILRDGRFAPSSG